MKKALHINYLFAFCPRRIAPRPRSKTVLFTLLLLMGTFGTAAAQNMSVNTTGAAPDSSAMLDVSDTTRGFLMPRLTSAQMSAINNPAEGLMIYNTDSSGFYFFDGVNWMEAGANGEESSYHEITHSSASFNTYGGSNYAGATDYTFRGDSLITVDNASSYSGFIAIEDAIVSVSTAYTSSGSSSALSVFVNGSAIMTGSPKGSGSSLASVATTFYASAGDVITVGGETYNGGNWLLKIMAYTLGSGSGSGLSSISSVGESGVVLILDRKTIGGGAATSGVWQTRDLNEVQGDTSFVSLNSNEFTLTSGAYMIEWSAPAYAVNRHQARLYNVTNASLEKSGSSEFTGSGDNVQTMSKGVAAVDLSANTTFRIEHNFETANASSGLGVNNVFSGDNVYTQVRVTKLDKAFGGGSSGGSPSSPQNLSEVLSEGNNAMGDTLLDVGAMGIGTTSPSKVLHVRHDNNNGITTDRSVNTVYSGHTWQDDGNEAWFIGQKPSSNNLLVRSRGNTNLIEIDTLGQIGIGTSSPVYNLELVDGTGNAQMQIRTDDPGNYAALRLKSVTREYGIGSESDGNLEIRDQTAGTTRVTIDPTGWVGVGIDSAKTDEALTIQSGLNEWGLISTNGAVSMGTWLSSTRAQIGTFTNTPLDFITNDGAPIMTVNTNNSVGIGTTFPVTKLHVLDTVAPTLTLASSTGAFSNAVNSGSVEFLETQGTAGVNQYGFRMGYDGNANKFRLIRYNFTEVDTVMSVTRNEGYVGFGTDAPRSAVDLSGQLIIRKKNITGWPIVGEGHLFMYFDSNNTRGIIASLNTPTSTPLTTYASSMDFRVGTGYDPLDGSNSTAMTIASTGNVGIGLTNPSHRFSVSQSISEGYAMMLYNGGGANSDGMIIRIGPASNPTIQNAYIHFQNQNGSSIGVIRGDGFGGTDYHSTSDRRLKTNINNFTSGLELISKMKPREYERKSLLGKTEIGFIAQELQQVYPQAVGGDSNQSVTENPMMVDYGKLTPLLTAGIKELHALILDQQTQIDQLLAQNSEKQRELHEMKATLEELIRIQGLDSKEVEAAANKTAQKK